MALRFRAGVVLLAGAAIASIPARAAAQEAGSAAEATVFIRVIGVMRAEFQRGWKQTREARDVELGTGSGFVISPSGYVLTNRHVVSGKTVTMKRDGEPASIDLEVSRIEVVFPATATRYEAHVEAVDADLDIAVLSISGNDLPFVNLGDSDALEPGETVQVIGFPYGRSVEVGQEVTEETIPRPTMTRGSVAALRESSDGDARYIQTDASVHPGNSGGPMLDAEGYAIGVIKMRLERQSGPGRAAVAGPAFAIPINKVKDFLEASSLERLFPARRLRLGPEQSFDWKRVRFRLPEGFDDSSPSRLRVQWAPSPETILVVERVASPLGLSEIEQALRGGRELPSLGAIQGEAGRLIALGGRPALTGRGQVVSAAGSPLEARYAIVDLGKEKIVAAYVGPAAQVAFNRAALEGWLRSVEAEPLLTREVAAPVTAPLEAAALPHPSAPALPMPQGWYREPLESSTCPQWAAPDAALLASPEGDFTVVLRGAWWRQSGNTAAEAAAACTGRRSAQDSASYAEQRTRLGVTYAVEGLFLRVGEGLLQLEASTPKAKAAHLHELFAAWARAAGPP
jgi:S1-C subfamily serine protease